MVWFYRLLGWRFLGRTVLLLTTTGRRTGLRRTTAVHYQLHGNAPVVCASNAGRPRSPAWLLNIRANPQVHVQRGRERYECRAVELDDEPTWTAWIARDPGYARMAGPGNRYPLLRLDRDAT